MKNESNNTKKIIEWWEAEKAMKNAKIPEIGKEFSTKDDACIAALGHKMNNRMHMGEEHERYNICFMQRGASSYIKDGKKVETGFNRIYADKVESLRANRKEWMPNFKKPCLIFVKHLKKNNPALAYYTFHGVFKVESVSSLATDLDYTVYKKV